MYTQMCMMFIILSFFIMSLCNNEDVKSDATQDNETAASADNDPAQRTKDNLLACYLYILLQQSTNVPPHNETTIDGISSRLTDKTLLPETAPENLIAVPNDTRAGCPEMIMTQARTEPDWHTSANAFPLAREKRASDACVKADAASDEMKSASTPIENPGLAWLALLFIVFIVALLLWQTHRITSDLIGVGLYCVCMTALWLFVRVTRTTKYKQD